MLKQIKQEATLYASCHIMRTRKTSTKNKESGPLQPGPIHQKKRSNKGSGLPMIKLGISKTEPHTKKPNQTHTDSGQKMVKTKVSVSVFAFGITKRFLSCMGDGEREKGRK